MSSTRQPIPGLEPVFDETGHLEETLVVALADGQDVPDEATAHLGTCDECCGRLAAEALSSALVGELLREPTPGHGEGEPAPRQLPAPWGFLGVALALSLVGLAPSIVRLPSVFSQAAPVLARIGPVLAHGLASALGAHGQAASFRLDVTLASSAFLILFGLTIARWFRHEGAAS